MSELEVMTVAEAATKSRKHVVTVRRALEAGELHGYQKRARGRWSVEAACLAAWVRNQRCEHQLPVAQRGHLRVIGGQR